LTFESIAERRDGKESTLPTVARYDSLVIDALEHLRAIRLGTGEQGFFVTI